jgi:hypothetical protein
VNVESPPPYSKWFFVQLVTSNGQQVATLDNAYPLKGAAVGMFAAGTPSEGIQDSPFIEARLHDTGVDFDSGSRTRNFIVCIMFKSGRYASREVPVKKATWNLDVRIKWYHKTYRMDEFGNPSVTNAVDARDHPAWESVTRNTIP